MQVTKESAIIVEMQRNMRINSKYEDLKYCVINSNVPIKVRVTKFRDCRV
jgi:hypothetical protein